MGYSQRGRRDVFIIDERIAGRAVEVYTLGGERIQGIIEEVATFELGISSEGYAYIVPRQSIAYISAGPSDIYGAHECCKSDFVLDEDFVGCDLEAMLINGQKIEGRLMKVSRGEIAVMATNNRLYVIPRSSIQYIKVQRR